MAYATVIKCGLKTNSDIRTKSILVALFLRAL